MPNIKTTEEIEVETWIDIYCGDCGAGLCDTCTETGTSISVPPCAKCVATEKDLADAEGYQRGFAECAEAMT